MQRPFFGSRKAKIAKGAAHIPICTFKTALRSSSEECCAVECCWISKFSSRNLCPQLHKLANMKGVAAGRDMPFFWEFQISLQEVAISRGRWCLLKRLELWLSSFMTPWSVSPQQSLLLLGHFQIQGLIWNLWHSWGSERERESASSHVCFSLKFWNL